MKEYRDYSDKLWVELSPEPSLKEMEAFEEALQSQFGAKVIEKLDGLDQSYWDFQIDEHLFVLHMDTFSGISLSIKDGSDAELLRNIASEVLRKI